jgi:NAD(P)-dependent dehydrogenase (short-subunit alcohol dehydrogenase family)
MATYQFGLITDTGAQVPDLQESPDHLLLVTCDVSAPRDVQSLIDRTLERFGRLDYLVNNAGIGQGAQGGPLSIEMTDAQWDRLLAVNARGTFLCSQAVVRVMLARGARGSIVSIASTAGRQGVPRYAGYSASKFAIVGFTQALAQEVASAGIRVNAVCPGNIDTDLARAALSHQAARERVGVSQVHQRVAATVPLGHWGTADDVANLTVFLLSDEASFITGQSVNVCGGLFMN